MIKRIIEKLYLLQKDNLVYHNRELNCFTRTYLEKKLKSQLNEKEIFISFVDVNNLKFINDTISHDCGDRLLKTIVNSLKNFGLVCRFGGDEFVVILENERVKNYQEFADKSREFSYGLTKKTSIESLCEAIKRADELMYINKKEKKK